MSVEPLSDNELASLKQCWLSSPRGSKSVSLPHDDFSRLLATIAARDARIKELEAALRDICTDENDAATRIARIALKGATDAKA